MLLLNFTVNSNRIIGSESQPHKLPHLPADTINYVKFKFTFNSPDWDNTQKSALFKNAAYDVIREEPIMPDGTCKVPWEVLAYPGTLVLSVKGFRIDETMTVAYRIVAGPYSLIIDKDNMIEALPSLPPTPTEYEEFVRSIWEYAGVAVEASDKAVEYSKSAASYSASASISRSAAETAANKAISASAVAIESRNAVEQMENNVESLSSNVKDNARKTLEAYDDIKKIQEQVEDSAYNASSAAHDARIYHDSVKAWCEEIRNNTEIVEKDKNDVMAMSEELLSRAHDAIQASIDAKTYAHDADVSRTAAGQYAVDAEESRQRSYDHSVTSKSWAVGGTGTREGEDFDNAKYYAGQSHADQIQANWFEDDTSFVTYIANRPFKYVGEGLKVVDNRLSINNDIVITEKTDWNELDFTSDAYLENKPFQTIGRGLIVIDDVLQFDDSTLPQVDWNETDTFSLAFIKNKPFDKFSDDFNIVDGVVQFEPQVPFATLEALENEILERKDADVLLNDAINNLENTKVSINTSETEHYQAYMKTPDGRLEMMDASADPNVIGLVMRNEDGSISVKPGDSDDSVVTREELFKELSKYVQGTEFQENHKTISFTTTDDEVKEYDLMLWDDSYIHPIP